MKKRNICSLIGQAGLVLAVGVLAGADAHARHLEPAEALSVLNAGPLKSASAAPLKLAYTQESEYGEAAVYVFDREDAAGFYVLAADDAVGDIVLGYSHTGSFSTENMPVNVKWLLEAYSQHVSDCADGMADYVPAKAPAGWEEISPLVTSTWAQTAPYNDMCPVVLGERSITGCVAVAVGQVMRKHKWPAKGSGSFSYSYRLNGQQYDISSNFSQHTYDWDNMLDSYSSYTTAQKNAVAQLLFDCGVTAQTIFIPDGYTVGSAGQLAKAATGMLTYFDYDKSMQLCNRAWYSDGDWETMMYHQISQGLPVLYSGRDNQDGGHAFVLDGYDGNGMFHFNMGWAGYCDGYYSVDGISYKYSQEAVINIKKNAGSSAAAEFAVVGILTTGKPEYKSNGETISFEAGTNGGFFSYSLETIRAAVGFKNTSNGNVAVYGTANFDPQTGFSTITIASKEFPKGEYDVYPVFKVDGSDWTPMKYDTKESSGKLHFINDGNKIRINAVPVDGIADVVAENVSVKALGGSIHIEAPGDVTVMVYDMTGALRYSGSDRIISMEKGRIYIVVVNGKAFKIKA